MTEGYKVQTYHQPVKRYCQTMDLKNEPALIKEYRNRHSEDNAWKEILDGIRAVGILEMEIYILDNRQSWLHYPVSRSGKSTWQCFRTVMPQRLRMRNGR